MNKKILIIIGILVVLIGIFATVLSFSKNKQSVTTPSSSTTSFSAGGSSESSGSSVSSTTPAVATLVTKSGGTVYVTNPAQGKTGSTVGSNTYYQLTNNQVTEGEAAQFDIEYGTDSSISIILLKEPIGAARLAAEKSLRTFFPLKDSLLCSLQITVAVPTSINSVYSGSNLGLSFCPGSTELPE